jgi:histidine triad (HIT) family protein
MPPDLVARLAARLPSMARAVTSSVDASSFNILQNNGRVAGQVIGHVHLHIIPRIPDDSYSKAKFRPRKVGIDSDEALRMVSSVKEQLASFAPPSKL